MLLTSWGFKSINKSRSIVVVSGHQLSRRHGVLCRRGYIGYSRVPLKPRTCERGEVIWMKSIGTREEQDCRKDYRILKGSDGLQFHGLDDFFVA